MNNDWSMSIIMPHRPLTRGSLTSPGGSMVQEGKNKWRLDSGEIVEDVREDIYRTISLLNKNSVFKHTILVAIDHNVFPRADWLSEFPNVRIVKSGFIPPADAANPPYCRLAAAYRDAILTVPDNDWICYGYTSDIVPCGEWDKYIWEAASKYGEDHVYVPMFVEMKTKDGTNLDYEIKGIVPTASQIWIEFREKVCCHGLTWPRPEKEYITEKDFDEYLSIMRRGRQELNIPDVIFEPCGNRGIGYYNVLCMRAKYSKMAGFDTSRGLGFDIAYDDNLRDKAKRMKGVVTDSAVYHPQSETFSLPFLWKEPLVE